MDPATTAANTTPKSAATGSQNIGTSNKKQTANNASAPSEQELKEEEELQLALALSLSETPTKFSFPDCKQFEENNPSTSANHHERSSYQQSTSNSITNVTTTTTAVKTTPATSNQQHYDQQQPLQQVLTQLDPLGRPHPASAVPQSQEFLVSAPDQELFRFVAEIQSTAEIFANRINSNKLRNRPVTDDSAIQSLFLKLSDMHNKLLAHVTKHDEERAVYEKLQDKLTQISDARAALDALREEHQEKLRKEAAEAERLRQNQLASKLEMMRQKKSEMMRYQRDMALQRIQSQGYSGPGAVGAPMPPATSTVPEQYVPPPPHSNQAHGPSVSNPHEATTQMQQIGTAGHGRASYLLQNQLQMLQQAQGFSQAHETPGSDPYRAAHQNPNQPHLQQHHLQQQQQQQQQQQLPSHPGPHPPPSQPPSSQQQQQFQTAAITPKQEDEALLISFDD